MTDITETLKADSTQLNAIDFAAAGPRTYTVESVRVTRGDQPVNIKVAEDADGREYRPSKGMRRALAACWGNESSEWTGRKMTLYCDPEVKWGGKKVGGIKISHASHIDRPVEVLVQDSSTSRSKHVVQPLIDRPKADPAPATPAPPVTPVTPALSDRIESAVIAFEGLNVNREQLAAFVGKPENEWTAADLDGLVAAFQGLQAGTMTVAEMLGGGR